VRSDQVVQTESVQGWDIYSFTNRHLQHLHIFCTEAVKLSISTTEYAVTSLQS